MSKTDTPVMADTQAKVILNTKKEGESLPPYMAWRTCGYCQEDGHASGHHDKEKDKFVTTCPKAINDIRAKEGSTPIKKKSPRSVMCACVLVRNPRGVLQYRNRGGWWCTCDD